MLGGYFVYYPPRIKIKDKTLKKTIKEDFKVAVTRRYLAAFDEIARQKGQLDKEICLLITLAPQRLSAFRAGIKFPTTEEIATLCTAFKFSLSGIILGTGKDFAKVPKANPTNLDLYNEIQEIKSLLKKK